MKSSTQIVDGGGWLTRQTDGRPRARFFDFLSLVWLGVSFCASFHFWNGWPQSFGWLEWLCIALLVPLPVFVVLVIFFFFNEKPRSIITRLPNPDYDVSKLY